IQPLLRLASRQHGIRIALDEGLQNATVVRGSDAVPIPLRGLRFFVLPFQSLFRLTVQFSEALTRLICHRRVRIPVLERRERRLIRGRLDLLPLLRRLAFPLPLLRLGGFHLLFRLPLALLPVDRDEPLLRLRQQGRIRTPIDEVEDRVPITGVLDLLPSLGSLAFCF